MKKIISVLILQFFLSLLPNEYKRSMYVDDFTNILGVDLAENNLLSFCQVNKFTYITLYDLHNLWHKKDEINSFISKAKTQFNIDKVGAAGENIPFFNDVIAYNQQYENKFDVLNLEFEYWSSPERPFSQFLTTLKGMKSLAIANDLKTEAYLGWPTESEALQIRDNLDRVLLHAYRLTPFDTFAYLSERLSWFYQEGYNLDFRPIFSAESLQNSGNNFMGDWLAGNSFNAAEEIFLEAYNSSGQNYNLSGFHYFAYSHLSSLYPNGLKNEYLEKIIKTDIFPNPFNPSATILYEISKPENVNIRIYNSSGALVRTLVNKYKKAGQHQVSIKSEKLNSGIYFCVIKAGVYTSTEKLILLK